MSLYKNMNALYKAGGSQFSSDASRRRNEMMAGAQSRMAAAEGDAISPLAITGERATALVLDARPTGRMIDHQPEIAFELLVSRRGLSSYPLATTQAVPRRCLLKVQAGGELAATVDPSDPRAVFLDFGDR